MIELLQRDEVIPPAARPQILIAEDDDEMRSLVAGALREEGYDVTEAKDGGRMLVRLARAYGASATHYDLLVSDVRMPVCSGLQILESLRLARWPTPFILMTAFGDDQTRARAETLGATVLMKPFDLDDLRATVLSLLESRADVRVPHGRPHGSGHLNG